MSAEDVLKAESFEASLSRLEQIVTQLERGDLALEDSLRLYEEAIAKARHCQARLQEAESRIEVLTQEAQKVIGKAAGEGAGR